MDKPGTDKIVARIFRFNPAAEREPRYQTYTIPSTEAVTVQALLRYIYRNLDHSLAFRNYNCYMGICGCCLVKVNGKNVKACQTLVRPGEEVTIGPVHPGPDRLIRDLACKFEEGQGAGG